MTNLDNLPEELRNKIIASQQAFKLARELHNTIIDQFPVCDLNVGVAGRAATISGIIDNWDYNDKMMQLLINSGKVNEINAELSLLQNTVVLPISANRQQHQATTLTELAEIFSCYANDQYIEYSIAGHGQSSMLVLFNATHAMAIYLNYPGDSGFTSANPNGDKNKLQEFMLANGQRDEYPESSLIDKRAGYDVLRYYLLMGEPYPQVNWTEEL